MAISRASDSSIQGGLPKFNDIWDGRSAVGGMDAIGVVSLSASAASITFSSIPQTYTHLQLRCFWVGSVDLTDNYMTFNGVGGTSYVSHYLFADGSSLGAGTLTGPSGANMGFGKTSSSVTTRTSMSIIDVLDYTNTNKYKTVRGLSGDDANGTGRILIQSGLYMSSTTVSSITFTPASGTYSSLCNVALYGVK